MADCYNHPGRDATGACINCGKMVCLECRTVLGEKIYCQHCADDVFVKGPAKAPKAAPSSPGVSGAWWLMPIFLTWIGGLIAWAVTRDRDPKRARAMLSWGIGLTFLYPLIYFSIVMFIALMGMGVGLNLAP